MERRARSVFVALLFMVLPSQIFSQGNDSQKQAEGAPEATFEKPRISATHCELPACVQKILYFSNVSQPFEFQDVVNTLRTIAEIPRVQQIPGERIIIVEGTAAQVAIAEKLAAEIDKSKRRFGGLGYRIELKVQESASDKPARTRLYSFLTEAHEAARVDAVGETPPAHSPSEGSPGKHQPSESPDTRKVECLVLAENERTVELSVEIMVASSTPVRIKQHVTLELEKPTHITRFDDPESDRSFTVEVTATRIKDGS